jgi:hypothetical protein
MAPQFHIFWAVSAPVTILVLVVWIVWLQRVEIANFLARRRKDARIVLWLDPLGVSNVRSGA